MLKEGEVKSFGSRSARIYPEQPQHRAQHVLTLAKRRTTIGCIALAGRG